MKSRTKVVCDHHGESAFASECMLMQRISQGDQPSLERLVATYGDSIALLIGRLLAWHADCDDVMQEVLLTAWRNAGSYRGQGSLEGWLKPVSYTHLTLPTKRIV